MQVLTFPPRESCRRRVSFESRQGTCLLLPSTKLVITFIKAERDKLIFVASLNLTPVVPVRFCFSDPARSTRFNFPMRIVYSFLLFNYNVPVSSKLLSSIRKESVTHGSVVDGSLHENSEYAMGTGGVSVHRGLPRHFCLVSFSKCFNQLLYTIADTDLAVLNLHTFLSLFDLQSFFDNVRGCSSENVKKMKLGHLQSRSLMSSLYISTN